MRRSAVVFAVPVAFLAALCANLVAPAAAWADRFDDANRTLTDLEERVRALAAEFREKPVVESNVAERRVVDAELLMSLKNHTEAATILLDVIEKYPNSRAYDDAIVLLGEALYRSNDLNSSRKYLHEAIKKNSGSRREQAALQRLIEIALKTNDLSNVAEYLGRLDRIPVDQLEPSVPYVRGKYFYFSDKLDEALATFNSLPASNPYFLQARYFIGTVQVKKGDLAAAVTSFDAVLRTQPRSDDEKGIQDLARLAIGRAHYERGQFDAAKEAYTAVPKESKYFGEALFELTWTSIKANDFIGAYRSLDLILLQDPDGSQAPELRILRGNLHLRLANYFLASENFSQMRDEFEPIYSQLRDKLQQSQTDSSYFETLLGKALEKFDVALFVPAAAINWVSAEPDVARMLTLADDLSGLQRDIRDSEETVVRLERAIVSEGKIGIFPDLASARTKSTEVLNQAVEVRGRFLAELTKTMASSISGPDKSELERIGVERSSLEQQLKSLPMTAEGMRKREEAAKGTLGTLDAQASEMNVLIQSLNAELVAIEQYFIHSKADQKIRSEDLTAPVGDLRVDIDGVRANLDRTRSELAEAKREFSAAGSAMAGERTATVRLGDLLKAEQEILQRTRGQLRGSDQAKFDRVATILSRVDGVQATLLEVDARVDAAAESRLAVIRETITAEKAELLVASQKLGGVLGESQSVGGGLATVMLGRVTDRFYDLVVQSDVGLIDVSWGLKDHKTTQLSTEINQQKLELKAVEDDFRSLLEEDVK